MEIGSSFQFDDKHIGLGLNLEKIFQNLDVFYVANCRSAIIEYLKENNFKKVYLPNFLCGDVYNCFNDMEKNTYQLNDKFEYVNGLEKVELEKDKTLIFVSNYFGLSDESDIFSKLKKLKTKNIQIMYDVTHSMLSIKQYDIVDCYVGSIRKWLCIPDGAFLCVKGVSYNFEQKIDIKIVNKFYSSAVLKSIYVLASSEKNIEINSYYRNGYEQCEDYICKIHDNVAMSEQSKYYFENFDFNAHNARIKNYNRLLNGVKNSLIQPIFGNKVISVPFCFPILCSSRDDLRKYLSDNQIYCAVHWDQSYHSCPNEIGQKILSLPIDQRYGDEDMDRLIYCLNKFRSK